jgi:hypothetical protein
MSKEPSPVTDALYLTLLTAFLSTIAAILLWGGLALLAEGSPSLVRVAVTSVCLGVYWSHYISVINAAK